MGLENFIRDSFWGRVIYHFSGHRFFSYKEEHPDFVIPDKYLPEAKQPVMENIRSASDCESSVSSSTDVAPIPRIVVDWDGEDDPDRPINWPTWQKCLFTAEICFLTTSVYMASAVYTPGIDRIMEDVHVSRTVAILPLTVFVVGYGIGPMVLSPMSENALFGRNYIYIATVFLFFIFQIPISLTNDIATLVVLRFFSGVFASPALATGPASLGDITGVPYLPVVLALWCMSGLFGPSMGPLFGSILVVKRDWHWTFWLVCMTSGIAFFLLGWFLPETFEKTLLLRKAKRLRKITGNPNITSPGEIENEGLTAKQLAIDILWRPFEMFAVEPIVLAIDLYIGLVYSIIYLWFEAFPIVYLETFKFALIPFGLTYISIIVGVFSGSILYGSYVYKKVTAKLVVGQEVTPETFLPIMIVGAVCMPVGIFIFGWTASADLHWFPPLIGSALFAVGAFIIFQAGFNYLGSSFYHYIASVFAGNNLFRSVMGGCFPLFANALFKNLSTEKFPVAWGCSVIGFISTAMIAIPVVFSMLGPKLRARSRYSSI